MIRWLLGLFRRRRVDLSRPPSSGDVDSWLALLGGGVRESLEKSQANAARVEALERRLAALEASRGTGSTPPGTVELKSPSQWRLRAPSRAAVVLGVLAALGFLMREIRALVALLRGG